MDSWVFDHSPVPAQWTGRFGASVPVSVARETIAVLPVQGASIIEVGPVKIADVEGVRRATARRRCRVIALVEGHGVAAAVAPYVDGVFVGEVPDTIRLTDPDIDNALIALADPSATVLATPAVLVAAVAMISDSHLRHAGRVTAAAVRWSASTVPHLVSGRDRCRPRPVFDIRSGMRAGTAQVEHRRAGPRPRLRAEPERVGRGPA